MFYWVNLDPNLGSEGFSLLRRIWLRARIHLHTDLHTTLSVHFKVRACKHLTSVGALVLACLYTNMGPIIPKCPMKLNEINLEFRDTLIYLYVSVKAVTENKCAINQATHVDFQVVNKLQHICIYRSMQSIKASVDISLCACHYKTTSHKIKC